MFKNGVVLAAVTTFALLTITCQQAEQRTAATDDQLKSFRSVKTVRIEVQQSYDNAQDVTLPYDSIARRLLEYAGLEVVAQQSDASLTVKATASALGRSYKDRNDPYTSRYYYTGASITGTISLDCPGVQVYTKRFSGYIDPPSEILVPEGFKEDDPSSAPFKSALKAGFLSTIFEMLEEIYGPGFLAAALREQGSVGKRTLEDLGKIGKPAVEPVIVELKRIIYAQKDQTSADQSNKEDVWKMLGEKVEQPGLYPVDAFRKNAVAALAGIGDPAVEPLIIILRENNSDLRATAAETLARIKDPRAVEPLIAALNDKRLLVAYREGSDFGDGTRDARIAVAKALGAIGDARAVLPLVLALKDEAYSDVWRAEAAALGDIKDTHAVEPLIALLRDKRQDRRERAAWALRLVTGEYMGDDPEGWRKWWNNKQSQTKKQ